jgi:hypothetical protein
MRKKIVWLIVVLGVLMAFGSDGQAQTAKEVTLSGTWVYSGTYKTLPLGPDRLQMNYDMMGVSITDTKEDPFNNNSFHCLGAGLAVKGELSHTGSCISVRPDGDQIFWAYKADSKLGGNGKGVSRITGGTGKMAGLQGESEYLEFNMRPVAEGTFQGFTKSKGQSCHKSIR